MSPVTIKIHGQGTVRSRPELAHLTLCAYGTGLTNPAAASALRVANASVRSLLRPLTDVPMSTDGKTFRTAVKTWHSGMMSSSVRSLRPPQADTDADNDDSTSESSASSDENHPDADLEFGVSTRTHVVFQDLTRLPQFTTDLARTKHVVLGAVEWLLSEEKMAEARVQAAERAYKDAQAQALAYARAMEGDADEALVVPVEVVQEREMGRHAWAVDADKLFVGDFEPEKRTVKKRVHAEKEVVIVVDCEVTFRVE